MAVPSSLPPAQFTPQDLLAVATMLEGTLNEAEQNLAQFDPEQQGASIQQMKSTIDNVVSLQNLVPTINMDDEDSVSISDKLGNCAAVIKRFNELQWDIAKYQDLFEEVTKAMQTRNQQALASLSQRVTAEGANPSHNPGFKNALSELQANIQGALQGNGHQNPTIQQPAISASSLEDLLRQVSLSRSQNQGTQTHTSTAYPTSSASTSTTSREELERQAALARISELKKQWLQCKISTANMSFDQKHEALLIQLTQLHQYSQDHNYTHNQDFVNMYDQVKQALRTMHFQQSKTEQTAKSQTSISSVPLSQNALKLIDELKKGVEIKNQAGPNFGEKLVKINDSIDRIPLTEDEKKKFFEEINEVKKKANIHALDQKYLKEPISKWQTQLTQKLAAAEKAFSTTSRTATTTSQPTESKLQKMYDAYNQIILSRPQGAAQTTFEIGGNLGAVAELKEPVELFEECINLLKRKLATPRAILEKIKNSPQIKLSALDVSPFSKFAGFSEDIRTRPSYHLWNIHRHEDESRLKDNINYGGKAFGETEVGFAATDEQRIRALKRSIVEISLAGLERAVSNCNDNGISHFLKILENIEYHEKDFPNGQKNYTHWLCGEYYNLHRAAKEVDSSLIDPHHDKFGNDFGRNGFKAGTPGSGLSKDVQTQAILTVCQQLKAAWGL